MDIFTSLYLDTKSLRPSLSKKRFKAKKRNYEETCFVELNKQIIKLNLNKNKNWETKNYLLKCIKSDPEYGKIKFDKTLTISVNKSGTNEENFYFSKEFISNRNDRIYYKREFKFGHITYKKNYDDHIIKTLKTKAKRKIKLDQDFLVVKKPKKVQNKNQSINRIIFNLKNLIESVSRDHFIFKTYEDPICSQSTQLFYFHQEQDSYSFRQLISNSECSICCKNSELKLVLKSCNHGCCKSCWQSYASFSREFTCCFYGCDKKLDLDFLKVILPKMMFKKHLKEEMEKNYLKCPQKCGNYFEKSCSYKFPRCFCGYSVCMECHSESHFPVNCETYQFYLNFFQMKENNNGDQAVVKGKFCPLCKIFIEKNGGCMYMRCICGIQFCWNCLQKVSTEHNNCILIDEFAMTLTEWEQKLMKPLIDYYDYISSIGKILNQNLNKKTNLTTEILNNKNFNRLSYSLVKVFKVQQKKINKFVEQIIEYSFNLIIKLNFMIELIFAEICFRTKNRLTLNRKLINFQKILIRFCIYFNKISTRETTMQKLNRIIYLDFKIVNLLSNYKNENFNLQ